MTGVSLYCGSKGEMNINYNGKKVGYFKFSTTSFNPNISNCIHIDDMKINHEYMGMGIGSEAYRQFEERMQNAGIGALSVEDRHEMFDKNFNRIKGPFWDKRGFVNPKVGGFEGTDAKYKNLNELYNFNQELKNAISR
jgi:hypothetical protein